MSDRAIRAVRVDTRANNPIELIARAELARSARAREAPAQDTQPDLVPPSGLNRPQGLAAVIDEALGSVELPTLYELQAALSSAEARLADGVETSSLPELDQVVIAVLAEEKLKIAAYMDVRDL